MRSQMSYLYALMRANMMSHAPEKKRLFVMSFFMMAQNGLFFTLWAIFFSVVKDVGGWRLEDVARMYGIVALSVGGALFFFNGVRSIAFRLMDGSLDGFITKPRAVLPLLMMSGSSPASVGDMLFGPVIWLALGNLAWSELPLLLFVTFLSMVVFVSASIIIFSIAFWLKGNTRFPEQLFEMLIVGSATVLHGQPFGVRVIAFTIIPAGFVTYLPAQIVRDFGWPALGILAGAACFYALLAAFIFKRGLRRYTSGFC